ncbi:MAG: hypothetical protein MUC60_06665 [Oscillatoria sp. Prado101]|nr:hypothetical protein [Oscillatoria sp. Prado101]
MPGEVDDTVLCTIENGPKLVRVPVREHRECTPDRFLAGGIEPSAEVCWGKPARKAVW